MGWSIPHAARMIGILAANSPASEDVSVPQRNNS